MAWLGDSFSSLSNLTTQIANFTKDVLSDGIVEEADERDKDVEESSKNCGQLQELHNSRVRESDDRKDNERVRFLGDSLSREHSTAKNSVHILQKQISEASVRIRELEYELNKCKKIHSKEREANIPDSRKRDESGGVKVDLVNRIIQIGEKEEDPENPVKKIQMDQSAFINDFRDAISNLCSPEQVNLIRCALSALETDNGATAEEEKIVEDKKNWLADSTRGLSNREEELHTKIQSLQDEKKTLSTSIEELNQQHVQSMNKVLSIKEEVQNKYHCLQTAYETLYGDYNKLQDQFSVLECKNANISEAIIVQRNCGNTMHPDNCDEFVQTTTDDITFSSNLQEITEKVQDILKNSTLSIPRASEEETFFEALAKEFLQIQWKKEMLERRITDVNHELSQACEIRDALKIDCDDRQTTVEALEAELQRMKSNLPCIPEVSEEAEASLDIEVFETESLSRDMKHLQSENDSFRQKHISLITDSMILEGSLRNQEALETEVRYTKQQLELAQQQLVGVPKNVSNDDNVIGGLSRRLQTCSDGNKTLRLRIDDSATKEKDVQAQLNIYSGKCEGLDDNIDLIEELKLDADNTYEEFKKSLANTKKLENELIEGTEANEQGEMHILDVLKDKEQLEMELTPIQKCETQEDNSEIVKALKDSDPFNSETDDLECDLLNRRKTSDLALTDLFDNEGKCLKFSEENNRFINERNNLFHQLENINTECAEGIELLHTEINSLQGEYMLLQGTTVAEKSELVGIISRLQIQIRYLKSKNNHLHGLINGFRTEYDSLTHDSNISHKPAHKLVPLEKEISRLAGKLNLSDEICERLGAKVKDFQIENEVLKQNYEALLFKLAELHDTSEEFLTCPAKSEELQKELTIIRSSMPGVIHSTSAEVTDTRESASKRKNSHFAILEAETNQPQLELVPLRNEFGSLRSISFISGSIVRETIEQKNQELQMKLLNSERDFNALKSERDELVKLIQVKHSESLQYHRDLQTLTELFNEQMSTVQTLLGERDSLNASLQDRDAKTLWAQNELEVLHRRLKNSEDSNNHGETCNIHEHSSQLIQGRVLKGKIIALEAALTEEQSSKTILQNELAERKIQESMDARELERLRTHLFEIEGTYTEEVLLMEQSKNALESKLREVEEKVKNSSTVYTSASIRANQQVETLQQQMTLIIQQRDDIQNKLSAAEDKVGAYAASLTNLQIVLEQFQRDKENDIRGATERIQQQLNASYYRQQGLEADISALTGQLAEAKEYLQAASRLSDQLEKKNEKIEDLTRKVTTMTEFVNTADEKIREAMDRGEDQVDKFLIKNLLLGFLSAPAADKSSVLRVFGTILGFNEHECEKAGLTHSISLSGRLAGLLSSGLTSKEQETSLSQAFIRFLENESKPASVPALSVCTASITRPRQSQNQATSSSHSALLFTNVNLPSFPDFMPSRNSGSILKEVLKDT